MNGDIRIRLVEDRDLARVADIQKAVIPHPAASSWLSLVRLQIEKTSAVCLVAEKDQDVIGFLFGAVRYGDFGLECSGWIEMFGVAPRFMGQGIGLALAREALRRFREYGVREIYTAVRWDSGDLLAFFKAAGFELSEFITLNTRLD